MTHTTPCTHTHTLVDLNNLGDPLGATNDAIDDLKSQLAKEKELTKTLKSDKSQLERKVTERERELNTVRDEMKKMTVRANQAEQKILSSRNGQPQPPVPKVCCKC